MHDNQSEWLHRSPADYRHTSLSSAISFCKACHLLYAVELLYNGHLGDRRKWPLLRGGRLERLKQEWIYRRSAKKLAFVERWLLEEVPLYFTFYFVFLKCYNTQQNPMEIATLLPILLCWPIWYEYKSMKLLVPM